MPIGLIFWVLMLLWLVLGLYTMYGGSPPAWGGPANNLLLFLLFLLLGWAVFGAAVRTGSRAIGLMPWA